jgi:hypothetical protein
MKKRAYYHEIRFANYEWNNLLKFQSTISQNIMLINLQREAWMTLLMASAVSLYISVLSESWTSTMLTGTYLLLIKFPGKVALYTLPIVCFCGLFTDALNSSQ